jgi:hypothetical protein
MPETQPFKGKRFVSHFRNASKILSVIPQEMVILLKETIGEIGIHL